MSTLATSLRRKYPVVTEAAMARLHLQSTFGTTYAEITTALASGSRFAEKLWVEDQLAKTSYDWAAAFTARIADDAGAEFDAVTGEYALIHRHFEGGTSDRLRTRWMDLLCRFFSVNAKTIDGSRTRANMGFYQQLEPASFGTFFDLIRAVSKTQQMGRWLTYVGKKKESSTNQPDENYARELMQLYTIGLWELNIDGSRRLTGQLDPSDPRYVVNGTAQVPTYTQADIRGLARVFTGYGSYDSTTNPETNTDNNSWFTPMVVVAAHHESGTKVFLQTTIPVSTTGFNSLDLALTRLTTHDSCAPFLAKNFIQLMTTSNPSPGYIARVASAFRNNGNGVVGDLKAFIRAILLDQEARSLTKAATDNTWGRIKDYWVQQVQNFTPVAGTRPDGKTNQLLARKFSSQGDWGRFSTPHGPPSVFRHYSVSFAPDISFVNAGLVAPELQLYSESIVPTVQADFTSYYGYKNSLQAGAEIWNPTLIYTAIEALGTKAAMLDRIALLMMGGQLSADVKTDVLTYMGTDTANEMVKKAFRRLSGYPEFYIQK